MDFKSLMSAQIAKSKSSTTNNKSSKYQRRADLEREREESYAAEQARLEQERKDRLDKKRKLEDEEAERQAIREEKKRKLAEDSRIRREAQEIEEEKARRKRLGLPERPASTAIEDGADQGDIPDDELRLKLEALGQPPSLTEEEEEEEKEQETHEERLARYRRLTAAGRAVAKKRKVYPGPVPTTIEPLPADEIILPTSSIPNAAEDMNAEAYVRLHRQIASYLNFLLIEWTAALAGRSDEDAQSAAGVQAKNNYKVVLVDLAPLMRRLEAAVDAFSKDGSKSSRSKSSGGSVYEPLPHQALLVPLVDILRDVQRRHYRDATDGYLRLSIGKAAWPIGVTMVGIHERSAREKLHEDGKSKNEVAHIMSDESTRKWLQSLKRCISFAQGRWAPYDIGQLMG